MYLMAQGGVRCSSDGGDGKEKPAYIVFVFDVMSTVINNSSCALVLSV